MSPWRVEVLLRPEEVRRALREEARAGLLRTPKELSPKWLYDAEGSRLFEEITGLDEYYPTRREREILVAHAQEIARAGRARTLIELGAGSAAKTRLLLDALRDEGTLERFVPFDVSEPALRDSVQALAEEYPALEIHGVVGDFERHLGRLEAPGPRMIAFLGGTLGNFKPPERAAFLGALASGMGPEDTLLLGTDLLKSEARLVPAYDDARGITAAFNLNVLSVLNRELGAQFDPSRFDHIARFDARNGWIEMLLEAREAHSVEIRGLELSLRFERGERLRTEVSTKFHPEQLRRELSAAGFEPLARWTDAAGDFALELARPAGTRPTHAD